MSGDWSEQDVEFMRAALVDATLAADADEVPVGAIVVVDGEIVAAAHNATIMSRDPSGHAEVLALRAASQHAATRNEAILLPPPSPLRLRTHARLQA